MKMTEVKDKKTIILTGGGTGGHVLPLIEVSNSLKQTGKDFRFIYLGSGNKLEEEFAKKNNIKYQKVFTGKLRRNVSFLAFLQNIADLFKLVIGYVQAIVKLAKLKPDLIFSKGGYVSLPVVLAGAFLQIPIVVHESDIVPGLANRIGMRFARRVALGFELLAYPEEFREKGFYCGIPLREEFRRIWERPSRTGNYLLVFGGSSGAMSLNDKIFSVGAKILESQKIVHITGQGDIERAREFRRTLPDKLAKRYECYGFVHDMPALIYRSKAVVMRAGATAIAEVGACKKKALLIPLPKSLGSHQIMNALHFAQKSLASYLPNNVTDKKFLHGVQELLASQDDGGLEQFYFPFSADLLCRVICDELEFAAFKKTKKFFLIGILGVSMSALAKVLRCLDKEVTGSDTKLAGHSAQNITADLDGVIYTSAANRNGLAKCEFTKAEQLKIPLIKRSQMIGLIMKGRKGITVSGMHGKTTISSIISRIFEMQYPNTSYLIGAPESSSNSVANYGPGGYFVAEACEYDSSFLDFPSEIAVISNIEKEHLDYFKNLDGIKTEFNKYIDNIYPGGALVYCADDKVVYGLVRDKFDELEAKRIKVISYGFKPTADVSIKSYKVTDGKISFSLHSGRGENLDLDSMVPGKHFALNCAAAVCVARHCGIDEITIFEAIARFQGASRRFERIGEIGRAVLYDDYGHHPTEILATAKAFAEFFPDREKVLVYQPHQQSRFNELFGDFVKSFLLSPVDRVIILPVFKVEGRDEKAVQTSDDLVDKINASKKDKSIFAKDYDKAVNILSGLEGKKVAIMTMGATDVWRVGRKFLE